MYRKVFSIILPYHLCNRSMNGVMSVCGCFALINSICSIYRSSNTI